MSVNIREMQQGGLRIQRRGSICWRHALLSAVWTLISGDRGGVPPSMAVLPKRNHEAKAGLHRE